MLAGRASDPSAARVCEAQGRDEGANERQSKILLCESSWITSDVIPVLWQTSGDYWQSSGIMSDVIPVVSQSKSLVWQSKSLVWQSKSLVWESSGTMSHECAIMPDTSGMLWQSIGRWIEATGEMSRPFS